MLTPAPLQHTQQCSCSKGLFNIQITTASAICRTLKIRRVFIVQIWILQKHRRELSTPISDSVNFIFAASAAGTDIVGKGKKKKKNPTHGNLYVLHKIPSQKSWTRLKSFRFEAGSCQFHEGHLKKQQLRDLINEVCRLLAAGWCSAPEQKKKDAVYLSSIPFINITRYKKNKLFSVSNSIMSADYRWNGMLIPIVVRNRIKNLNTINLA